MKNREEIEKQMMIRDIRIENFRGIKFGEIKDLGSINIILGPNGSGKSTVLESLYLMKGDDEDEIYNKKVMRLLAERRTEGICENSWWFRSKKEDDIKVTFTFDGFAISAQAYIPKEIKQTYPGLRFGAGESDIDETQREYFKQHVVQFAQRLFLIDSEIRSKDVEGELWEELTNTRLDKDLVEYLRYIYGLDIEGLTQAKGKIRVLFPDYAINIGGLGAGARTVFRLMAVCLARKPACVLIEEIDAYQHPDSLSKVADAVCDISRDRNIQFFITSHSEETYRAFLESAERKKLDSLKVYTLSLDEDGKLDARWSNLEGAATLTRCGRDLRKP